MPNLTYSTLISRTLQIAGKGLYTVVGLHNHDLSDADVNAVQDLQNYQRQKVLANQAASGFLTWQPFGFVPMIENTFYMPACQVLFQGTVIDIAGNFSADLTKNVITLPAPSYWADGQSGDPAKIYVVFLELMYVQLSPDAPTPTGYYKDSSGNLFFYLHGCLNCDASNLVANDTIDPFVGKETTQRAQIQWALRVEPIALSYDFTKYAFGLSPGSGSSETVWAYGTSSTATSYSFQNLTSINGDPGLWRAGDGNVLNNLGTLDGYSYAMPVAVVFQPNYGPFSLQTNPFGCGSQGNTSSGLLRFGTSGRYDARLADQIWSDQTIDTRSTVSLTGQDESLLLHQGFADLVVGGTTAIARGEGAGANSQQAGSKLSYYTSIGSALLHTDNVGSWDGFRNGLASDQRSWTTSLPVTVDQKATGTIGGPWKPNDVIAVTLPTGTNATVTAISAQALVSQSDGGFQPTPLLQGQITVSGLGSSTATLTINDDLTGTSFDPGANPLYLAVTIEYPSGGMDLGIVPQQIMGGTLRDAAGGDTFPLYGTSEYGILQSFPAFQAWQLYAINPEYSPTVFGTRVWLKVAGSSGTAVTLNGATNTTYTINRLAPNIEGSLSALYPIRCWDTASGNAYTILARSLSATQAIVTLQGGVPTASTIAFGFLLDNTAQAALCAPVRGLTTVAETVKVGTATDMGRMDPRVKVLSTVYTAPTQGNAGQNTIVLGSSNGLLRGISGDDTNQFCWVKNQTGTYDAVEIGSVEIVGGLVTIVVPATVNLVSQAWFCAASFMPALDSDSQAVVETLYVPYQGEGVSGRDYEIRTADASALVTTNGTGAAPIIGLQDAYPYSRELPLVYSLPAGPGWADNELSNAAIRTHFDDNYDGKAYENTEVAFEVPCHSNDFVAPLGGTTSGRRTTIRLLSPGGRGFTQATPHVGFAIRPASPRTIMGQSLQGTTGAIQLYVNNATGSDLYDGLSPQTPKLTLGAALAALPSVLAHPCSVQLAATGKAYLLSSLTLQEIALGDGIIIAETWWALGNLSFTVQGTGRLVIAAMAGSTTPVVIDGTLANSGTGPVSAFFIDHSRAILQGLTLQNFTDPALKGIDSEIELVDCILKDNLVAGSFEDCVVTLTGGTIESSSAGVGIVLSGSQATAANVTLSVDPSTTPGAFYVAAHNSSFTLQTHGLPLNGSVPTSETNVGSTTLVAQATLNSAIICAPDFVTSGQAAISGNSLVSRATTQTPFLGGVVADATSNIISSLD